MEAEFGPSGSRSVFAAGGRVWLTAGSGGERDRLYVRVTSSILPLTEAESTEGLPRKR